MHEHQRLDSSWLSDQMHLSEPLKDLFFKMVMVDKALEEIALQAHWHRVILKKTRSITDPFRHSSAVFLFSSTPLLIWAPSSPIHHTRGAIAVMHFQPCGQLSPALPNIHNWIPGSLQLEKVFRIKSTLILTLLSPALFTPSQSSTRGPPQAAAPAWPIYSGFLDDLQHLLARLFQCIIITWIKPTNKTSI